MHSPNKSEIEEEEIEDESRKEQPSSLPSISKAKFDLAGHKSTLHSRKESRQATLDLTQSELPSTKRNYERNLKKANEEIDKLRRELSQQAREMEKMKKNFYQEGGIQHLKQKKEDYENDNNEKSKAKTAFRVRKVKMGNTQSNSITLERVSSQPLLAREQSQKSPLHTIQERQPNN